MLASPAVLPATLTIIERHEGRGPAVAEVTGAVPGAVALTGFALVAADSMTKLPLAAALLLPLVTWVVAAVGGYLALAKLLPAWSGEVRRLAFQRRGLALVRRAQASSGARQAGKLPGTRTPHGSCDKPVQAREVKLLLRAADEDRGLGTVRRATLGLLGPAQPGLSRSAPAQGDAVPL